MEEQRSNSSIKKRRPRVLETHHIHYNIDKSKICPIIEYIFSQTFGFKVFGYNKTDDNYWCKTMVKSNCTFFISISIQTNGVGKSVVTITDKLGTREDFKMFISRFMSAMRLYVESPIIGDYLDSLLEKQV